MQTKAVLDIITKEKRKKALMKSVDRKQKTLTEVTEGDDDAMHSLGWKVDANG